MSALPSLSAKSVSPARPLGTRHFLCPDNLSLPNLLRVSEPTMKRYSITWGPSFVAPGTKEVAVDYFSADNGFDDRDREIITGLEIGKSTALCDFSFDNLHVTRLS